MLAGKLYLLLFAVALVLAGLGLRDYVRNERRLTPAVKVRMRISLLFIGIGLYLFFTR